MNISKYLIIILSCATVMHAISIGVYFFSLEKLNQSRAEMDARAKDWTCYENRTAARKKIRICTKLEKE